LSIPRRPPARSLKARPLNATDQLPVPPRVIEIYFSLCSPVERSRGPSTDVNGDRP
jgi:hypothetical protein